MLDSEGVTYAVDTLSKLYVLTRRINPLVTIIVVLTGHVTLGMKSELTFGWQSLRLPNFL